MNVTELTQHKKKELRSESKQKRGGILCFHSNTAEEIDSTLIIGLQGYTNVQV
jgi:hypothetical protein